LAHELDGVIGEVRVFFWEDLLGVEDEKGDDRLGEVMKII